MKDHPFFEAAHKLNFQALENGIPATEAEYRRLAEKHGISMVGAGDECVVIDHPHDPEKVIAVSLNEVSPEHAKILFYFQEVLHILFPHNFPKFYASFGTPSDSPEYGAATVRQKIVGVSRNPDPIAENHFAFPLNRVKRDLINLGIRWNTFPDEKASNGLITKQGEEFFVDLPDSLFSPSELVRNKVSILRYMEAKNKFRPETYSQGEIQVVARGIDRIKELIPKDPAFI